MEKLNAAFIDSAAETLRRLRAADENLQFLLGKLIGPADDRGVRHLKKDQLESIPALADALFDLLQPYGFSPEQVRQVVDCWDQPGKEWHTDTGRRLVLDREELLLADTDALHDCIAIGPDDLMVRTPDSGCLLFFPDTEDRRFPDESNAILIDAEKLRFPLSLRHWTSGDHFQPLGMKGQSQKLQDFFTNQKISRIGKERVWILENGDKKIIWVVGMRLDERFKISEESRKLLKICWIS